MNKKRPGPVLIVISVFLFIFSVGTVWAEGKGKETFFIGPFEKGEPFLTSSLEEQLVSAMGRVPKGSSVKVIGYTDSSGSPEFNRKLALWRARQVSEKITKINPEVEVIKEEERSGKGNYRMVRVDYSYSLESPTISQVQNREIKQEVSELKKNVKDLSQEVQGNEEKFSGLYASMENLKKDILEELNQARSSERRNFFVLLSIFVLGILLLVFLAWMFMTDSRDRSPKEKESETQPKAREAPSLEEKSLQEEPQEEWVKINSHKIRVEVTEDRIWLPFISSYGERMYRSSWRDVKKALKGAFKKDAFADQIEKLKREGKIREDKI